MQHRVTNNLVLRASSTGAKEWSQSISIGQDNSAMFEVWLRSVSKSSGATVQIALQGSNDLEKWATITQTSTATIPGYVRLEHTAVIAQQFLRLRYNATRGAAPLTPNVNLAGTITTYRKTT